MTKTRFPNPWLWLFAAAAVLQSAGTLAQSGGSNDDDASDDVLYIPDGGRRFRLGELFDARTDTVVPGLLWEQDLIERNKEIIPASFTSTSVLTEDRLSNRAALMDIDVEIVLAFVIFGPAKIEFKGSFEYMQQKKSRSNSISMATSYRTRTNREAINAFSTEMLGNTNQHVFGKSDDCVGVEESCKLATHFVASITWGANVIASFESFFNEREEETGMRLALAGKLGVPSLGGPKVEAKGSFTRRVSEEELVNRTQVRIHGDLQMSETLPTSVDEALDFMKKLPENTETLIGSRGVPMDVVLVPLKWLDSDAAKLSRRIGGDALLRLAQVYDAFDESEALLNEVLATRYAGFLAWRRGMDSFYREFQKYRSEFSLELGDAMSAYKAGNGSLTTVLDLEQRYYSEHNRFSSRKVASKCRDESDAITNLMSLASEFPRAGIEFAETAGDFFGPTFDTSIDKVYALLLVGSNPSNDRPGISQVRDFVALALSRYDPTLEGDGVKHCEFTLKGGKRTCKERLAFIAIHFDSFCDDFCHFPFCPSGIETICPSVGSVAPCEISDDLATRLGCRVNNYTGVCGIDDSHSISNNDMPLSDCWCACPKTQIMLFHNNFSPVRLTDEDLPRNPPRPKIFNITGADVVEEDPFNQALTIELEEDTGGAQRSAFNYLVNIEWTERSEVNGTVSFVLRNRELYTVEASPKIPVNGLSAGVSYTFNVAGLNSVGQGISIASHLTTVAHRMADEEAICVSPEEDGSCLQPEVVSRRTYPSWVPTNIFFRLSIPSTSQMERITIHDSSDCGSIGLTIFNEETVDGLLQECSQYVLRDNEFANCTMNPVPASNRPNSERMIQLCVWNDADVLIAKGPWTLLAPSSTTCSQYGMGGYFCEALNSCVSDCFQDCGPETVAIGGACRVQNCEVGQLFCPVPSTFRPPNAIGKNQTCLTIGQTDTDCALNCHPHSSVRSKASATFCAPPCFLDVGIKNLRENEQIVVRGETVVLDCLDGFRRESGSPIFFTCPPLEMESVDERVWEYDLSHLSFLQTLGLSNYSSSNNLVCKRCPEDQIFDDALQYCRYERVRGLNSQQYVTDGSFSESVAGLLLHFDHAGSGYEVRHSEGVDQIGGSAFLPATDGGLLQRMTKPGTDPFLRESELSASRGSIWAAALFFRPFSDKAIEAAAMPEGSGVGRLCLFETQDPASATCVPLLAAVPALPSSRGSEAWYRVDLRHTVVSSISGLTMNVTSLEEILVDGIEVIPVEGEVETAVASLSQAPNSFGVYFSDNAASRDVHLHRAQLLGGNLASIHNEEEQKSLMPYLGDDVSAYTGGYLNRVANQWEWTDGTAWDYQYWLSGQPSGGEEDVMTLWAQVGGRWNDRTRGSLLGGFYQLPSVLIHRLSNPPPQRPGVAATFAWQGFEYYLSEESLAFEEHRKKALDWGGDLASIHSSLEEDEILTRLRQNEKFDNKKLLLGGRRKVWWSRDSVEYSIWVWTDGSNWDYSHWKTGEPNDSGGRQYFLCLTESNGKWDDVHQAGRPAIYKRVQLDD